MALDRRITAASGGHAGDGDPLPWWVRVIGILAKKKKKKKPSGFGSKGRGVLSSGAKKAPHGVAFTRVSAIVVMPRHQGDNIFG